ncbi:TetR/AcrR family transcriptional regulator [Herbiconiux ginsengi]|uniref:Transcriptional regulator, TetR family n=1 Tax=Herbiconiux ginsengi TaxID=381665 RepID=A0A1H3TLI5_9MICO|nr:TetR/AcrR family transcriptional regulator [Herbiconiux ginsengi]SDZ50515.1 transcriptional regulator, TetR family [Herbiconiux ginsengi]
MAKRGRPTATERAERRERILDAAVAQFSARGFGATTLDEVAAASGVTKRTLYVDVGDKAALFAAAVEREHDRIQMAATDAGTLIDVATEMVLVLHSDSAVALHRSIIAEAPRFPEVAREFYSAGPQHSIDLLARHLPGRRDAPGRAASLPSAAALYSLLLGEPHRRRLLALDPAPSRSQARAHALAATTLLALPLGGTSRSAPPSPPSPGT